MAEEREMGFLDHLEELRWRLVKSAAAIVVFASLAFINVDIVFDGIILAPKSPDFITYRVLCQLGNFFHLGDLLCFTDFNYTLQNINMSGQLGTHIMVSIIAGIVAAFPFVFYQLWSFVKPGLKQNEQSKARGIVFYASVLFLLGVAFGYYVLAPLSIQFLGTYRVSAQVENQISLDSFISTVTSLSLYTGIVFELPIAIYFLAKIGIISATFLKKYRKHAFLVVLIVAAIITPPDVLSQCIVTVPLMLLYETGIMVAARMERKQASENN
ncbi:MAG TPA: twin-arginine translocase subunit TatC [Luteibaculaceae bacterium]|nr:twin-arginine translocase subunit TatC [Luteibaculaceae bacterium]